MIPPHLWLAPLALVALVAVAVPDQLLSQAAELRISASALVRNASARLATYQRAFAFLIADEHYVQRMEVRAPARRDSTTRDPSLEVGHRTLRGELFLTYLGADRRWVALHDVAEVDGVPVEHREDLRALLAVSSLQSVAARLFRHNARYNIGSISRNFNEPTLALLVLDPAHAPRFRFTIDRVERSTAAATLVTLAFRERDRPTIVRTLNGGPVYSAGELTLEAETGVVRQTRIRFRHEAIEAEQTTVFELDERLALWVPSLFTERYATGPRDGRPAETITAEARYTNYRRFETRSRLATSP